MKFLYFIDTTLLYSSGYNTDYNTVMLTPDVVAIIIWIKIITWLQSAYVSSYRSTKKAAKQKSLRVRLPNQ